MRIVSGRYKGRRIPVPKTFKARPTTDFAKENLFNILNNFIDWEDVKALDLFGGTGSISFELISRGCPQVICIEKHPENYTFIEKTKQLLEASELKVFKTDVFKYLSTCKEQYDFIFADPPYDLAFINEVPQLIFEKNLIKDGGVFIMEHSKDYSFETLPYFKEKRIYGSVNFSIFIKEKNVD